MRFRSLRIKNFRNYADLVLEIPPGIVVFYGPNGHGKTNLIEALHLLLRGESFRPVTPTSLLNFNSPNDSGLVLGQLQQQNLLHDVRLSYSHGKKTVAWNNRQTSACSLARQFPLVLFSPESLAAIKDGPEARRQLLDDVVRSHSLANSKTFKDFQRALRTRNRILRDAKRGLTPEGSAQQLLQSLDASYFPLAVELTMARLQTLKALQNDFQLAASFVLKQSAVDISVEYLISQRNVGGWSRSDLFIAMHNRALELRETELRTGLSLVGPQRHDIRILFAGKDSRFFCSQGQQRALILSFKMAQILYYYRAYQVYPVLLLDDVLSELDPIRRANLVKFLKGIPAQIFLTTTDLSFAMDFGDRRINVFRIEQGAVEWATQDQLDLD